MLIVIVLVLSTFIGWLITSNILNSIHLVQQGLSNFFEYLHNRKKGLKRIEINSKDEFFQMADMINENVANIKNNIEENEELIKNATKVLEDLKSGDLSSRLTKNSSNDALNELKIMMNNMIDNLEFQIQEQIDKPFWIRKEPRKHRYVYILAKGGERRKLIKSLKHPILEYPKSENEVELEIKKLEPIESRR